MTTGTYLRKLRLKHGYSVRDLAELTAGKLDKTTVSRIERGERQPSLLAAHCLRKVYGIDLNVLADMYAKDCGLKVRKVRR